jgi:phage minor structural protein
MYKVYSDYHLLHDDRIDALKISNAKVELEVNKTGAFEFTIYPDHPYYGEIQKLKSIITVYQDDYLLFRGRVLNDELGFYDEKQVVCEGQLAFLLDSIQRPTTYSGTLDGFIEALISAHNSQVDEIHHFALGNVTVGQIEGFSKVLEELATTWEVIDKLIEELGGYIQVRNEGGINYIDYLSDFSLLSSQKIEFKKNLLDMKRIRKGEDIGTVLIPLGAKIKDEEGNETGERQSIKSVNNDIDYIEDAEAIAKYGRITKFYIWDEITDASELLAEGIKYLASLTQSADTLELTAADLNGIEPVESFHIGTYVQVTSKPHGINERYLVSKLSISLNDPSSNKLTLGGAVDSLTEQTKKSLSQQENQFVNIREEVTGINEQIFQTEQNLQSSIDSTADNISLTVAENYYKKDETESLVSTVQTELNLTKDALNLEFTTFKTDLEALATGTDAEFEEIKKYIRFVDGKILLGEVGNELELQIANDKISFVQDGAEVAYFTNRKLYVTDGEYTNSLRLGSFAFMPRANGNLSFKKV